MASSLDKTGVFYFQAKGDALAAEFPQELRNKPFSQLEPRFLALFFGSFLLIGGTVFTLSFNKPSETANAAQIQKIQERYASLVLNQPVEKKPEPVKAEVAQSSGQDEAVEEEPADEEVKAQKESVTQRAVRREATSAQRQQKREQMKRQIENVGIFAELTAVGSGSTSGGSSRRVQDLIGNIDASSQSLSSVTAAVGAGSGGFVSRKESGGGDGLRERRGERTEGGTIEASGLTSASGASFKSAGNVEVSNVDKIEGEAANDASRSMTALNSILRKYQPRLIKVYEDYLKRNPELSGKIVVKFTIEADGSVSNVSVVSSDLNNPSLETDIIRRIERIKFPPASGKITIEWPLVLTAS